MKVTKVTRIFSALLALVLAVGLLSTGALAIDSVSNVVGIAPEGGSGDDGTIVVTVYDQEPGNPGTGEVQEFEGDPVNDIGINALCIGTVVELTSSDASGKVTTQVAYGLRQQYVDLLGLSQQAAIASQDQTYYFVPSDVQDALSRKSSSAIEEFLNSLTSRAQREVTGRNDEDGQVTFKNLEYGLYLLAKSGLPGEATTDLVPFLVSVPMYVEGKGWQSTVHAYPKVRTGSIQTQKSVNSDEYIYSGQTLTFTVTETIDRSNHSDDTGAVQTFTQFVIHDTNASKTLNVDPDSIQVAHSQTQEDFSGIDAEAYGKLDKVDQGQYQYYYEYTDLGELTITLTPAGLGIINDHLATDQTITLTYNATISTDADFAHEMTNTAYADYQRSGMTQSAQTNQDTVSLSTFGVDLTKTLSDHAQITADAISFKLYHDPECTDEIFMTEGKNGYWTVDQGDATMCVGTDGQLKLYGLEPGTYYLKEDTTMSGYALLTDPIEITITGSQEDQPASATVNRAQAQLEGGLVYLTVENTKLSTGFTLPQTGGTGTLMVTAAGLGLLCVGVILVVVYRKKRQN